VQDETTPFRIAAVPGVTLTKWTRAWQERRADAPLEVIRTTEQEQLRAVRDGSADVSFVRLPVEDDQLSVIPLYAEAPVVVVPKEHPIAVFDSVTLADLVDERHLGGAAEDAIELVAANVGVVIVPQSIARLHNRKDVVARPVTDAAETTIALAWLTSNTTEGVEEFIGIVRGRTARSSRQTPTPPSEKPARAKQPKSAQQSKARPTRTQDRVAANRRKQRGNR
jgi:DNA-binding transcriptional LysR family regulator